MSSDTAAASKQTTSVGSGDSTVESGVGHGEISDAKTKGTGDGGDTKDEVLSNQPDGESGTSGSREEGGHDSTAEEHYNPRGPPKRPVHGGPKPIRR